MHRPRAYRLLFDAVLTRMDAERAHHLGMALIRFSGVVPRLAHVVLGRRCPDPILSVRAFGLTFPGPLGLAAGFDKDATAAGALAALGFGFVEVGTVTAMAQPGNPRPRLFRLPADRAVLNRMGFNNGGADAAAARLRRGPGGGRPSAGRLSGGRPIPIGVNIGKTKTVPPEGAVEDYRRSARAVADAADYLVVNVSSPNTPGLRDLQTVSQLRPLLVAVREELDRAMLDRTPTRRVPLLVKIAPDLADDDILAIADLALELGLDGIIATNTTISRAGLRTPTDQVAALGAGGISGEPLRTRSLEVLRLLRDRVGDRLTLVSVGGVADADDVWERITAGASLVQAYTAFVYGGPDWPRQVHRDLAQRVRAAGLDRLQAAIGTH